MRLEGRCDVEGDVLRGTLAERHPDQRRVEQELRRGRHDCHVNIPLEVELHGERRGKPAEAAAQDDDLLTRHLEHLPNPCTADM
jgi:hypothetical protein